MKALALERASHARRIVVSPTRGMWDGSTGKARCSGCTLRIQYTAEEKISDTCPRCGSRLVHTGDQS